MLLWCIMLIAALSIPTIMIIFGWKFQRGAPKKINQLYGYRTRRSMMNRQTWDFAHRSLGRYWWKAGLLSLIPTVAVMLAVIGKNEDTVAITATVLCAALCVPLCVPALLTEQKLKRKFDENGCLRNVNDLAETER